MENSILFNQITKHLLEDDKPSNYLNSLKNNNVLDKEPFCNLKKLEQINQSPNHHPEGNVWVHTMMVVDVGAKYKNKTSDPKAFMWTLLLHDLGKLKTTKFQKGRYTAYDHDKVGEKESEAFLRYFDLSSQFVTKVKKLVRYHMHLLFVIKNMPYSDVEGMIKNTNLTDLCYVFFADRSGRGNIEEYNIMQISLQIKEFYKIIKERVPE